MVNPVDITQSSLVSELNRRAADRKVDLPAKPVDLRIALDDMLNEDAEGPKHDPKNGQFVAGPGAKPSNASEHKAQAEYHEDKGYTHYKARPHTQGGEHPHKDAQEAHSIAKNAHLSAAHAHQLNAGSIGGREKQRSEAAHRFSNAAEEASKKAYALSKKTSGGGGSNAPGNYEGALKAAKKELRDYKKRW